MLSDFLQLLRIRAEVYHNAKICGDWQLDADSSGQSCFHMPTIGGCIMQLTNGQSEVLEEGDLALFPREVAHSLRPSDTLEGPQQHVDFSCNELLGTGMLCGRFKFGHSGYGQLLDVLPEYLIIRKHQCHGWLPNLHALILKESFDNNTQSSVLLDRLCEMIFIYSLMYFIEEKQSDAGMFSLYANKPLEPALKAIHSSPADNWTLESLAQRCAMSRTRFAQTFKDASGWSAMQYVTWWRMQLALSDLKDGKTLAQVADRVGYQSEASFGRAFKKVFGYSAGQAKHRG